MKAYAGIGSRETPKDVLSLMHSIGYDLACKGWTLRSGCAPGADSAFEEGAFSAHLYTNIIERPRPELYLPWPGFEGRRKSIVAREVPQEAAYDIAAQHHPNWGNLRPGARSLHARNVHQILGHDIANPSYSRFVICWTKDAAGGGGTGQAIRIARHFGIPVFDLADEVTRERVMKLFDR